MLKFKTFRKVVKYLHIIGGRRVGRGRGVSCLGKEVNSYAYFLYYNSFDFVLLGIRCL